MPISIEEITFDCADPERVSRFWARALGYQVTELDDRHAKLDHPAGTGPRLHFQRVPEPKVAKNRVHPDLWTEDLDAEVARLEGLGARVLEVFDEQSGRRRVMADPDGNEFCLAGPV